MKPVWTCLVVLSLELALCGRTEAQGGFSLPPDAVNGPVTLTPAGADGNGPIFLDPMNPALLQARQNGTANGKSVTNLGNLQIGFDYLRPFWSFRDFTLAVPSANAGSFPLLGDVGHVDDHFAFAPRVRYNYDFTDLDFGISASGTFLTLTGRLLRQVSSTAAGVGDLTANSTLTLFNANLPEFTKQVDYADLIGKNSPLHCGALEDLVVELGIGSRYSFLSQNYTGSLTNSFAGGSNVSTRYSSQSFQGFGLTTSMGLLLPAGTNWILYSNLRGSVLIGDNRKDSTLTVNVAGQPGLSTTINESKTSLIPVGEFEAGVEWGMELGARLREGDVPPLFTVRVAIVGQYWGDVGPLSAGSSQAYRSSDLFLVGAHVMVGFHH